MAVIDSEEQKEKRLREGEQNLKGLWNIIKQTNVCTVEVPDGEERILEVIMSKNFPNLIKDMNINMQEAQSTTSKVNSETHTKTYYNKTLKSKDKENFESSKRSDLSHMKDT